MLAHAGRRSRHLSSCVQQTPGHRPSVRTLASEHLLNPLTVNRALQALADAGLVESRRGLGMFVRDGAREQLRALERERFLHHEWPRLRERLKRLDIQPEQLSWEDPR